MPAASGPSRASSRETGTSKDGKTVEVHGFAVLQIDGESKGFRVNLLNGDVRKLRGFPNNAQVVDLAFPLDQR